MQEQYTTTNNLYVRCKGCLLASCEGCRYWELVHRTKPPRSAPSGLVNGRITARCNDNDYVGLLLPGGFVWKRAMLAGSDPVGGGARGVIKGFSRHSRQRLTRLLASVDWGEYECYFVTLTYREPDVEYKRGKEDLRAFRGRLERRYGKGLQAVVWREEFQRRGTVHFHLVLIWRVYGPHIRFFRQWVATTWNSIAAPGDVQHLQAGTGVELARNTSGRAMGRLLHYLCKYMSKTEEAARETGRIWGYWGLLPRRVLQHVELPRASMVTATRRLRRWGKRSRYVKRVNANWRGGLILYDGDLLGQLFKGLDIARGLIAGYEHLMTAT